MRCKIRIVGEENRLTGDKRGLDDGVSGFPTVRHLGYMGNFRTAMLKHGMVFSKSGHVVNGMGLRFPDLLLRRERPVAFPLPNTESGSAGVCSDNMGSKASTQGVTCQGAPLPEALGSPIANVGDRTMGELAVPVGDRSDQTAFCSD